jgi:3-methyladenine DNA glycosylase AlkC
LIEAALPPPLDPNRTDDDFGRFIYASLGEVAVKRGLEAHRDRALDLLEAVTQRFSMEYAIRPFLNRWPKQTMERMTQWADHPHYHVRRLVSEGTRPKLPWGMGIKLDPMAAMPLLDRLYADPTRFVTRSVANHLNDISKLDARPVIGALNRWKKEGRQSPKELDWIIRHATRDLVKKAHPGALSLLGYKMEAIIDADLTLPETARIGEALEFSVALTCREDQPVLVDYAIGFQRATGVRRKVHKLSVTKLKANQPLTLKKRHKLPADAPTYKLNPGPHEVEVVVNGRIRAFGVVTFTD